MERYNAEAQGKPSKYRMPDDLYWKEFKNLCPFLTDAFWSDGKVRSLCTLTIRLYTSQCSVSLNDKTLKASVNTDGKTLAEALAALDEVLGRPGVPWRPWKS